MPGKGLISASAAVLFESLPSIESVAVAVATPELMGPYEAQDNLWFGGPALLLPFRADVGGHIRIDLLDSPWPDHMGHPEEEPDLFAAWSQGHFGPFTFPGALDRAKSNCWHWAEGPDLADAHQAAVRISASYTFLTEDETAPLRPDDYDPIYEVHAVTQVAQAILDAPGALSYFNPNGEILGNAVWIHGEYAFAEEQRVLPVTVHTNVRMWQVNDTWTLMDTVGANQYDVPDVEIAFQDEDPNEVGRFLRNIVNYLGMNGDVINDGDTMEGIDSRWVAQRMENPLVQPPRLVIRFTREGEAVFTP